MLKRHALPLSPCFHGCVNGVLDVFLAGVVVLGYYPLMVIRLWGNVCACMYVCSVCKCVHGAM